MNDRQYQAAVKAILRGEDDDLASVVEEQARTIAIQRDVIDRQGKLLLEQAQLLRGFQSLSRRPFWPGTV